MNAQRVSLIKMYFFFSFTHSFINRKTAEEHLMLLKEKIHLNL